MYKDCKNELLTHKGECKYCGESFLGNVCKDAKDAYDTLYELLQMIEEANQDEKYDRYNELCDMQNKGDT